MIDSQNKLIISRLLIGAVFTINIQCAISFILIPERYTHSFGLAEESGMVYIAALGILFLMWNVPYFFAMLHPIKKRLSLIESIIMQTIGLVGESILYFTIPIGNLIVKSSLLRFIIVDSFGLSLLVSALWYSHLHNNNSPQNQFSNNL